MLFPVREKIVISSYKILFTIILRVFFVIQLESYHSTIDLGNTIDCFTLNIYYGIVCVLRYFASFVAFGLRLCNDVAEPNAF